MSHTSPEEKVMLLFSATLFVLLPSISPRCEVMPADSMDNHE
jgi:hypothetical protein